VTIFYAGSTEPARNVIFRFLLAWLREDFRGRPKLNQFTEVKESGVIGDTASLLHVMSYDDDGVMRLQFVN
jgi:hypothetical protein